MLDALTFFSPVLAIGRWVSAHGPAVVANVASSLEEFEVMFDQVFSVLSPFFFILFFPPLFFVTYRMFRILLGPV